MILFEGVLAGAAHVLSGPDHLAGVAPLAVDRTARIRPVLVGASWGLGHGLGVALLGVLGQTLLGAADIEVASGWAERLVGIVLIVIGAISIRRARGLVAHEHMHTHGAGAHVHLHVHENDGHPECAELTAAPPHRHRHAAFGIGIVHGLAGAGHFWAVLPSLAMGPSDAALYIGGYVVMSLTAMALFGLILGRLVRVFGPHAVPRLMSFAGGASILVGTLWLLRNLTY